MPKERIRKINLHFLSPLPVCLLTCIKTANHYVSNYKTIFSQRETLEEAIGIGAGLLKIIVTSIHVSVLMFLSVLMHSRRLDWEEKKQPFPISSKGISTLKCRLQNSHITFVAA